MSASIMEPSLMVLRRQLNEKKRVEQNIHNLAKSMFRLGVRVEFASHRRTHYGEVVEVIGTPGNTWIRVTNLSTRKVRDIRIEDVTGLVKEN
jgi:hypothetical protein